MTPKIGIFWLFKEKVFGCSASLSEGEESYPGLLDCSKNHTDVWDEDPSLLAGFPELSGHEYFSVPRGRVLWNKSGHHAVVYMDSTLFNVRCKELIVNFFELDGCEVKWKRDAHYTTKPEDLKDIFDDKSV